MEPGAVDFPRDVAVGKLGGPRGGAQADAHGAARGVDEPASAVARLADDEGAFGGGDSERRIGDARGVGATIHSA